MPMYVYVTVTPRRAQEIFPLLGSVPNFDSILGESLPTLQHKIIPGSGSITPVTTSAPRNCGMIRTGGESSITDHSYL